MFTLDELSRLLRPLREKIYRVVGRAILTAVNNGGKTQFVQIQMFGDEVFDAERFQEYGLETLPDASDPEFEALPLAIGGNKGQSIVACVHNRSLRPRDLGAGDVCLYSKGGQRVWLKADGTLLLVSGSAAITVNNNGDIDVNAGSNKVVVTAAEADVTTTGDVNIDASGNLNATVSGTVNLKGAGGNAVMLDTIISKYNEHTHLYTISGVGQVDTSAPDSGRFVAGVDSAANVKAVTG